MYTSKCLLYIDSTMNCKWPRGLPCCSQQLATTWQGPSRTLLKPPPTPSPPTDPPSCHHSLGSNQAEVGAERLMKLQRHARRGQLNWSLYNCWVSVISRAGFMFYAVIELLHALETEPESVWAMAFARVLVSSSVFLQNHDEQYKQVLPSHTNNIRPSVTAKAGLPSSVDNDYSWLFRKSSDIQLLNSNYANELT